MSKQEQKKDPGELLRETAAVASVFGALLKLAVVKVSREVKAGLVSGLRQVRDEIEAQKVAMAPEDDTKADDGVPETSGDDKKP